jgi:hypothetical protein
MLMTRTCLTAADRRVSSTIRGARCVIYVGAVKGFAIGFGTASLLWGIGVGVYAFGGFTPASEAVPAAPAPAVETVADAGAPTGTARRRRGVRRSTGEVARSGANAEDGAQEVVTGDTLAGPGTRTLDVGASGGEGQLSDAQIERSFDAALPRIRRCLLLVADDAPVTGRLVFGLQIAGTGRVSAVNLSGPRAVVGGEAGDCLREAARGIGFPTFDGPTLTARYPLTLE